MKPMTKKGPREKPITVKSMNESVDKDVKKPAKSSYHKRSHTFQDQYSVSPSDQYDHWYNKVLEEPSEFPVCPSNTVQQFYQEAEKLLASETTAYEAKSNKNSEKRWMRSIMTRGTTRDKIASYTLMVQEAPMYNLKALESLIWLVKPAKQDSVSCVSALVELFVSNLLKPNEKLKPFASHPLMLLDDLCSGNPAARRRRLVAWYFEDKLKALYRDFIEALQRMVKDTVDSTKEKAIGALGKLLRSNSEQEAVLLSYLVNKLGDPNKQVASKAMHCLTQTLHQHPNMKGVMMDEVEKLLFRPNIGQKARYYSVCFLAQMMFSRSDSQLAAKLIKIYFSFFRACVKEGSIDSRLLRVLLNGVNRAYPYAREAMDTISEQLETLYKVVHLAPFHIALHALSLLFQVADYKNSVSDRFYCVLYRILLHPSLAQSSHFAIFLNLFYRAIKKDENAPRIRAFIKRALQVCCFMPVPLICGTLFTLSHLMRSHRFVASLSVKTSVKVEESSSDRPLVSSFKFSEDDSDDEHYNDILEDEHGGLVEDNPQRRKESVRNPWDHKKNLEMSTKKHDNSATEYDSLQRNPLYAHGELCCYTELCLLASHFHPTVALFASRIISGEFVSYSGDPLKDFTLSRFLERFTFKNPKKQPETTQNSVFAKRQNYVSRGLKGFPLTSKAYINQQEEKIPIDERFLFKFLQQRRERSGKEGDGDSDVESVGSEEFDDVIDDLMAKRGLKADVDVDEEIEEEDIDVDFANEYSKNAQPKKKRKRKNEDDSDASFSDDESSGDEKGEQDLDELAEDPSDFEEDDDDLEDSKILQPPSKKKQRDTVRNSDNDNHNVKKGNWEDESDLDGIEDDIDGLSDFDDMEAIEFGDESEDEGESLSKKKRNRKDDWESRVFVPTEEFAELLESAGRANQGVSGALSNKDKAGEKQLAWEMNRDRWIKGNYQTGKKGRSNVQSKKRDKSKAVAFSAKKPFGLKKTPFKRRNK